MLKNYWMLWIKPNKQVSHKVINLLLVNGWSVNALFWAGFEKDLVHKCSIKIIDLDKDRSLEDYMTIIDSHITPNTLLVGWSLGGTLAIQYAAMSQQSFLGVVTLQTNPCFVAKDEWPGVSIQQFRALEGLVKQEDWQTLHRQFSHLLVKDSKQHRADRSYLKPVYQTDLLPSRAALTSSLLLLENLDVRDLLTKILLPALHIYGGKDNLVDEKIAAAVQKLSPSHQYEVIEGMAHLPSGTYRSQIQCLLNNFVDLCLRKSAI